VSLKSRDKVCDDSYTYNVACIEPCLKSCCRKCVTKQWYKCDEIQFACFRLGLALLSTLDSYFSNIVGYKASPPNWHYRSIPCSLADSPTHVKVVGKSEHLDSKEVGHLPNPDPWCKNATIVMMAGHDRLIILTQASVDSHRYLGYFYVGLFRWLP